MSRSRRTQHLSRAISAMGVVTLSMLTSACGYVEMHEAVLRPTTGPTPNRVELYLGDQHPGRAFYEVALVEALGYGSKSDVEYVTSALGDRGKLLGCDAIVRIHVDVGQTMTHGYGVCVKWSRGEGGSGTVQVAPTPAVPSSPAPTSPPPPPPSGYQEKPGQEKSGPHL